MPTTDSANIRNDKRLFWGCFIALAATGVGFVARTQIIGDWALQFNLTETQKGEILGVGFWPFAISIILFSMVIDRIGYRNAMIFGFVCHVISAFLTIFANGFEMLYIGTFIMALGNGTVEAYINPVVATMYSKEKTKWLNILHAGWPAGIVIGGILVLAINSMSWHFKVALIFIPVIIYLVMLFGIRFPVNERVAAGVSYKDMLKEVGIIGALIISSLISAEIGTRFGFPLWVIIASIVVLTGVYGWYTRSWGNGLFLILVVIMIPLATTELGTDSWITSLMEPEFARFGQDSLWLLIYTSTIMAILRMYAGPIVRKLSPLGLLAFSSFLAALGLIFLSKSVGMMILAASTLYGFGKTFFWPTMLGVVAERFPKGGAMTLNGISGVGMMGIGIIGAVFLGNIQDRAIDKGALVYDQENATNLHESYVTQRKKGIFGEYYALNNDDLQLAPDNDRAAIQQIQEEAKKGALSTVAVFPVFMLICYIGLILYFKSKGGYAPIELNTREPSPK